MGQKLCCNTQTTDQMNQLDFDNYNFNELDYNRCSTYVKLENISNDIAKQQNLPNQYSALISRIIASKQEHLLHILKDMQTVEKRTEFISLLETIDFEMIDSLYHQQFKAKQIQNEPTLLTCKIQWIEQELQEKDNQQNQISGLQLIYEGKVGLVILAGGKGERFSLTESKLVADQGLPSRKSLLQIMFEKIKKIIIMSQEYQQSSELDLSQITIFILLNEFNSYQVKQYLSQNKYFGIPMNCVEYCYQRSISVVDEYGHITFSDTMRPNVAPNGTGNVFQSLQFINFQDKILSKGIQYLQFIGCDNLVSQPLDPVAIHLLNSSDADLLCKIAETQQFNTEQSYIQLINNETFLSSNESMKYQANQFDQEDSSKHENIGSDTSDGQEHLQCMNDMVVRASFLKRLTRDPIKSLKFAQKYNIIKRDQDCYNHQIQEITQKVTLRFEKNIHDLIDASQNAIFFKVKSEEQLIPIVYNQREKGVVNIPLQKLSNLHKKWLQLPLESISLFSQQDESEICEIIPLTSYNGEGLIHYIEKFKNHTAEYPILI